MSKVTVAVTITERQTRLPPRKCVAAWLAVRTKTVCGACGGVGRLIPDYDRLAKARDCSLCGGTGVIKPIPPPCRMRRLKTALLVLLRLSRRLPVS
jgi:hypothetical protein